MESVCGSRMERDSTTWRAEDAASYAGSVALAHDRVYPFQGTAVHDWARGMPSNAAPRHYPTTFSGTLIDSQARAATPPSGIAPMIAYRCRGAGDDIIT
ncbi:MAG: hypothetical protein NVS2B7_12490 [Herpetosiphon sp.]